MTTFQLLHKISSLRLRFDPSWIDKCPGCPGPIINEAMGDYMVAQMLRDISVKIKNRQVADRLMKLAKEIVTNSSKGLVAGWEDGDDICPPWWRFPFPPKPGPGPDPVEFYRFDEEVLIDLTEMVNFSPAMEQLQLAGALKNLATLTQNKNFSEQIFSIGQQVVKEAAPVVYEEYCGTVPKPRPKPHYPVNVAFKKSLEQFA